MRGAWTAPGVVVALLLSVTGRPALADDTTSRPSARSRNGDKPAVAPVPCGVRSLVARYYDPATGRFITQDPVLDPNNAGNQYTFVGNNPTTNVDPSGMIWETAWDVFNVGLGLVSFAQNVMEGNFGMAAVDALGVLVDTAAAIVPFVPGGVGTAVKTYRAGKRVGSNLFKAGGQIERALDTAQAAQHTVGAGLALSGAVEQYSEGNGASAAMHLAFGALGGAGAIGKGLLAVRGVCFLEGTLVETRNGRRTIESLRVGDEVLSRDERTGEQGYKPIVQLFRGHSEQVAYVRIAETSPPTQRGRGERHRVGVEGAGEESGEDSDPDPAPVSEQTIRSTVGHPYFVVGRGWVHAKDLRPRDQLVGSRGETLVVVGVEVRAEQADHYNFEVADWHTYFVAGHSSAAAVWVHNAGCGTTPLLLPGSAPGTVTRNRLEPHEFEQATRIVEHHGGTFIGATRRFMPGIDGTFNGVPAALKRTQSRSPSAVLHHASKAEAQSEKAGHVGVHLFVEAQNVSAADLLDFARGGNRALLEIPSQGVISRVDVLTSGGWVTLPGRRVGGP